MSRSARGSNQAERARPQPVRAESVSQYVAAALVGVDASDEEEARVIAEHSAELSWEVAAVAPVSMPARALEPVTALAASARRRGRPVFGRFSVVALPMMAYAYVSDSSAIGIVVSGFASLMAAVGF